MPIGDNRILIACCCFLITEVPRMMMMVTIKVANRREVMLITEIMIIVRVRYSDSASIY